MAGIQLSATQPSQAAPAETTKLAPTKVSSETGTPSSGSVYIYTPLTPGLNRYDFNTGKKITTPP